MTSSKLIITKWFGFSSRKVAQWESTLHKVTPSHPALQNWAGSTLKSIKLHLLTKRHRNKNGWKIEQFWTIWKKRKSDFSPVSMQTPPDNWPDALDYSIIGLVAENLEKLVKIWYLVRDCPIWKSHCGSWSWLIDIAKI